MDYYSGTPDPEDYSYINPGSDENPNDNKNSFFKTHYNAIMIGLACLIALFMLMLFLTGNNSGNVDDVLDSNSNLSELTVTGGTMIPDFMSGTIRYTIRAKTSRISFSCTAVSTNSTILGCDDEIEVIDDKITHEIVVTSKNGNKTTYYLTIVKA